MPIFIFIFQSDAADCCFFCLFYCISQYHRHRFNKAQRMLNGAFLLGHAMASNRMYQYCYLMWTERLVGQQLTALQYQMMDYQFDFHPVALHFGATLLVHFGTTPKLNRQPIRTTEIKHFKIELLDDKIATTNVDFSQNFLIIFCFQK